MFDHMDIILSAAIIAAQIGLGVLFADLMSGIVHWYIDTYGDPKTPILGKHVYWPTINHHAQPLDCTRASFWSRNGPNLALSAAFLVVFLILGWINAFTLSALATGVFASEIHVWSHKPKRKRPPLVHWLQSRGVLLSPKEHWQHHTHAHNTRYCTVTNLLNPALDRLRIFRLVEGFVEGFGRRKPRDEIMGIGPLARGRRIMSRARRFVAAHAWQVRRMVTAPVPKLALA
ncbi:fatty acid desaturase family protein [Maricaulis sp.]|jgi:TMEM189-like protein|uniref:fatty acid desaturase family protein n=1 Tax=Maricaulis sp. TaxID=1486257 RepID=UPI0025D54EC8|nr:fatty acid desaturase family protein [Maricaulis sp.]MDF1767569.1 fatty acid desaturase family protein [Maricaulis sp.]